MTAAVYWLIVSGVALAVVASIVLVAYLDRNDPDMRVEWMRSQLRKKDRWHDEGQ